MKNSSGPWTFIWTARLVKSEMQFEMFCTRKYVRQKVIDRLNWLKDDIARRTQ